MVHQPSYNREYHVTTDFFTMSPSDWDSKYLAQAYASDLRSSASSTSTVEVGKHYHGSKYPRAYSYKFTLYVRCLLLVLEWGACIYFHNVTREMRRKEGSGREEEVVRFGAVYVALIAALIVDGSIVTAVLKKRYHDFWAVVAFIADCGVYGLNMWAMLTGVDRGGLAGLFGTEEKAVWVFLELCWVRSCVWVAGILLCIVALCRDERKERARRALYR
ncbi:hypothetical protein B0T20DRAFT_153669 [Sordaria brevicollis]|uniref:Uncharacterized protein n=1 Tax=Sordaria brevicollis TaxID=83679 RepID=A0AAE0PJ46_SORBR|nr:hypothetical protein B0T20DRAFT_153669 [Sordaria brevicollis]